MKKLSNDRYIGTLMGGFVSVTFCGILAAAVAGENSRFLFVFSFLALAFLVYTILVFAQQHKAESEIMTKRFSATPIHEKSILIPAIYAFGLALLVLIGVPFALNADESSYENAVKMPFIALIIGVVLGGSAFGLLKRQNWGRYLFLLAAPWASIALGSVFASFLWQNDLPYTAILILAYVAIAFMLSRFNSIHSLGVEDASWRKRGGTLVAIAAVVMIVARLIVSSSTPVGGSSIYQTAVALNKKVQYLVLCDIPMWNYIVALIAVSIPTRKGEMRHA